MTRVDPITFEKVKQAAAGLLESGQKPTVRLIRSRIGGSNTTILKFFQDWEQVCGTVKPPAGVPTEVVKALQASYDRVAIQATSDLLEQLQTAQTNVGDLAAENEGLQLHVEELSQRCAAQASEKDLVRGQLFEKAAENQELRSLLAQAQATTECARIKAAEAITSSEINAAANHAYQRRETELVDQLALTRGFVVTACAEKLDAQQRAATCTRIVQDEREKCSMLEAKICQLEVERRCVKDAATQRGAAETTNAEIRADITALRELLTRLTTSETLPSTLEGSDQAFVEDPLNEETVGPDAIAS